MGKLSESQRRNRGIGARISGVLTFAVLLWFSATPVCGQFHVLLSPQIVPLKLKPGVASGVIFELTNQDEEKPVLIRLFAQDVFQGPKGEYKLSDTAMSYSCADWLILPETLITVGPDEVRQVQVGIKPPYSAIGGAYAAVVFEILQEKERRATGDAMGARFEYRFQMPAWIEIEIDRPRGSKRQMASGEVKVTPTADDPSLAKKYGENGMVVSAELENTGNVHVRTNGRLIIRDANRRLIRDTRLGGGRGTVLPAAKARLETIMQLPPPGTYTLKTIVEYGGRSPAISQTSFEITRERAARTGESEIALPLWIDLRPDRFEPSVPADGFRVFGVTLMNREDAPVEVDVDLGRIHYDEDGQMWVSDEAVDSGRSCAQWLTIEPRRFALDPQQRKNVRVTLNVPEGAAGGYYSCLVINGRMVADTGAPGLPTPMYCPILLSVPPDFARAGEIVDVVVDRPRETAFSLDTKFRNTGNIHELITGTVKLEYWTLPQAVEGLEVTSTARFEDVAVLSLETDSTYVLPGEIRSVSSQTAEGLPGGRYRARVSVNFGGEAPATLEREFVIKAAKVPKDLDATGGSN